MDKRFPLQRVIFDLHGVLIDRTATPFETTISAGILTSLRDAGVKIGFVTNSSSLGSEEVSALLQSHSIKVYPDEIVTAGLAMAAYIERYFSGSRIYLIGKEDLRKLIERVCLNMVRWTSGDQADVVVVGRDPDLTEEKLEGAATASRRNAVLLATSRDRSFPANGGYHPGPGYTVDRVESAMGVRAYVVGKPNPFALTEMFGLSRSDLKNTLIVGDSFDPDVLFGMNAGAATALLCESAEPMTIKEYSERNWILYQLEQILQLVGR